jgi:hypothetical protein
LQVRKVLGESLGLRIVLVSRLNLCSMIEPSVTSHAW